MSDDNDQKIMAYADGALSRDEAASFKKAIAADPELAAKLALYRRTRRARLAPLFQEVSDRPVPPHIERLSASIDKALREAARPRTAADPGVYRRFLGKLDGLRGGASPGWALTLGVAALGLTLLGGPLFVAGLPKSDPFRIALETARSGERISYTAAGEQRVVMPMLSFLSRDKEFCRLYELTRAEGSRLSGIACRTLAGEWPIKLETEGAAAPASGYSTARSAIPPRLGDAVESMIEGSAYGRDEEDAMLRRGWR